MTDPHADFPFTFTCQRSGNCCSRPGGIVQVTDADARAIAEHLDLSEPAFRSRYLTASGDRLKDGLGTRCIFLADGARASCTIYPVRPHQCRTWPFWPELLESDELLREACRLCPGIRQLP